MHKNTQRSSPSRVCKRMKPPFERLTLAATVFASTNNGIELEKQEASLQMCVTYV